MTLLIWQRENHFRVKVGVICLGIHKAIDAFIHQFKFKLHYNVSAIRAKASFIFFSDTFPLFSRMGAKKTQYLLKTGINSHIHSR
jgi:hypothetical protein